MRTIGFSTGAVALGDFDTALDQIRDLKVKAVELSALRLRELPKLIAALTRLDLSQFTHISIHAPSAFTSEEEPSVIKELSIAAERGYFIVVHPDAMHNVGAWTVLGDRLCIENMDKRKPVGRTADELRGYFAKLPLASLCFDIAHSRQIDSSMTEAYRLLREFGSRVRQVHVSEVNSSSRHVRMSISAAADYEQVLSLIPQEAAFIIEAQLPPVQLSRELAFVSEMLSDRALGEDATSESTKK